MFWSCTKINTISCFKIFAGKCNITIESFISIFWSSIISNCPDSKMSKMNPSVFLWHLCLLINRSKVVECGLSSQKGLQKVGEMRFFSFVWLFVTSMARKKCHHLSSFLLLDFWSDEVLAEKPSRPFHSSAASFKSVTENDSLFACAVDALNECDYPSFCRFGALLCGLKGKGLFSW